LHHVNEIAQSEAYLGDGQPWVKFWLHNEFLQLGSAKISKSAGHILTVSDLAKQGFHPLAYRLFLLGGHYRAQLEFTMAGLDSAQSTLRRLVRRTSSLGPLPPVTTADEARAAAGDDAAAVAVIDQIDDAISSDLNTPRVLALNDVAERRPEAEATDDIHRCPAQCLTRAAPFPQASRPRRGGPRS
jgi:cysteinyl-tRNA synthetase